MKKLGLALGAGGSRGIAHIGFLRALEENDIKPDYLSGSSMGAVVGACYAMGMSPAEMFDEVVKLKISDVFDLSLNPIGSGALLRSKKMQNKLYSFYGDKTFNDLKIPFKVAVTSLNTGESLLIGGDTSLCDAVTASSSIPGIFRPVRVNGHWCVDGGVQERVPLRAVKDMGADVVVGVDVLGEIQNEDKGYNLGSIILRAFEITDYQLTKISIKENQPDLWIEPEMPGVKQYKFKNMEIMHDAGYKSGQEYAKKIKQLLK